MRRRSRTASTAELERGEHARLVGELEALVAEFPLRERLRGVQMLALYRSGRHADALAAYRTAREALDTELGLEPGPELRKLEQQILTHDPALQPAAPGVPAPPATPTFGRDDDVLDVLAALEGARLVTLTGPGGVGKTRLAIEVARAAGGRFVPLAPIADDDRIPEAACAALGVHRMPGEGALEALRAHAATSDRRSWCSTTSSTCPAPRADRRPAGRGADHHRARHQPATAAPERGAQSARSRRSPRRARSRCSSTAPPRAARRIAPTDAVVEICTTLGRAAAGDRARRRPARRAHAGRSLRRGSRTRSPCSAAARRTHRNVTGRSGPRSTGASSCWRRRSATPSPRSPRSPAGASSTPPRRSPTRRCRCSRSWWTRASSSRTAAASDARTGPPVRAGAACRAARRR